MRHNDQMDNLSRGETTDPRHGALHRYRTRALGGTSKVWGGRVAPLDPLDFEKRSHVPDSGWPISYTDLDPYYRIAQDYLSAGEYDYNAASVLGVAESQHGDAMPSFGRDMLWRFSDPIDLGRSWRQRLLRMKNLTVLLNTTVTELRPDETGTQIQSAVLKCLDGTIEEATAQVFVVAAGGLESTRLLQLSRSPAWPDGLGNKSGLLGRYYTSHLAGTFGPFRWLGSSRLPGARYERDSDGVYVRRTLSLDPHVQQQDQLLNVRFTQSVPTLSDPSHHSAVLSSAYLAKRFLLRKIPPEFDARYGGERTSETQRAHVNNVFHGLPELAGFAPQWFARRILPRRKLPSMEPRTGPLFFLHFDAEQTPMQSSTVRLSDSLDPLGCPRLTVDWRVHELDTVKLARTYSRLCDELRDAAIASIGQPEEDVAERIASTLGVGSHHIGTTRMSSLAREGVVDSDCRVHGVRNLFVASSSTFCTPGVANPTLTITALAVRIARTIRRDLGRA
jgi:choline dehydrogenase-like flavoprotein